MESTSTQLTNKAQAIYKKSVLMIILGGACFSLLGIGMRVMENPVSLQIIFYRSIAQAAFLGTALYVFNRKDPFKPILNMGGKGVLISCFLCAANLFMVLSVAYTTVANAVFIVSLAPLSSALLGRIFLGERVSSRTWLAIAISLFGVAIIFKDGLSSGGLLGMFFAFLMMAFYSASVVTVRSQDKADMIAVCALNGAILAVAIFPFVDSFTISNFDLMICVALGVFQIGLGMVLITSGAQHVPAAQVSLLALLEVVLSPIWVWIGVNEVPSVYSLIGGAIVLFGVVLQALQSDSSTKPKAIT